ncbi:restriction endonuclease [Alicyclobacillus tolerans]|uniref:restriction endonuclease n=1 Tax=Alicyclobacillus tolerans TaxID=90970 RepID=UPI003B8135BB
MARRVRRKRNVSGILLFGLFVLIWGLGVTQVHGNWVSVSPNLPAIPAFLPPCLAALVPFVIGTVRARRFILREQQQRRSVSMQTVDRMDGVAFERFIGRALVNRGWTVAYTKTSGDFGADLVAERGRERWVFQCKRYNHAVGVEAVQQVYAAMTYYQASHAVVVTNHRFTEAAKVLAESTGVELWARDVVETFLTPPVSSRKTAWQLW